MSLGLGVETALCHTCRKKHSSKLGSRDSIEFFARHEGHLVQLLKPNADLSKQWRALRPDVFDPKTLESYGDNANVKEAFGTAATFTKTNANLASSATAGWMSNVIDNSSNLYLDALVVFELAAVNTAPANSKAIFAFAYGRANGTDYTSTGDATPSGSEGTCTHPDVSTLPVVAPLLGVIPYPVQNKAINSPPFSVAHCFGGILPDKWGITMVNHSGMTLSVTNIYYIEVYNTVS